MSRYLMIFRTEGESPGLGKGFGQVAMLFRQIYYRFSMEQSVIHHSNLVHRLNDPARNVPCGPILFINCFRWQENNVWENKKYFFVNTIFFVAVCGSKLNYITGEESTFVAKYYVWKIICSAKLINTVFARFKMSI